MAHFEDDYSQETSEQELGRLRERVVELESLSWGAVAKMADTAIQVRTEVQPNSST